MGLRKCFYLNAKKPGTQIMAPKGWKNVELPSAGNKLVLPTWHTKSTRQENILARNPHILFFILLSK